MKKPTKDKAFNALYYFILAMMVFACLITAYSIGVISGLTDGYKTQLKKKIEMLEQQKQESMIRQLLNEKQ